MPPIPPAPSPDPGETFDLAADRARCRAAARALLAGLALRRPWPGRLWRRYADPALPYHDAAHIGLLWLRHLAHGGTADDRGMALAILFHDAVLTDGAPDNEIRSATLLREAVGPGGDTDGDWAAGAILATADHRGYRGSDPRVLRFLDLDLTPLAEHPTVFARNTAALRHEAGSPDTWAARQRRFLAAMLTPGPLYRSGLAPLYDAPARRNLEAAARAVEG